MIDKNYRESALNKYGEACEICGHRTSLEVHHIDYQEHQQIEDLIRNADRHKITFELERLLKEAKEAGYDEYKNGQLSKNDSTINTAVLCGNCHSLVHTMDVGKKLLKAIKTRSVNV